MPRYHALAAVLLSLVANSAQASDFDDVEAAKRQVQWLFQYSPPPKFSQTKIVINMFGRSVCGLVTGKVLFVDRLTTRRFYVELRTTSIGTTEASSATLDDPGDRGLHYAYNTLERNHCSLDPLRIEEQPAEPKTKKP